MNGLFVTLRVSDTQMPTKGGSCENRSQRVKRMGQKIKLEDKEYDAENLSDQAKRRH